MPKVSALFGPISALPPGGGPATDEQFMAWARSFAADGNARILDRYPPDRLPARDPLPIWRLVNHLLKTFHDTPIDWSHLNNNHRIRSLGVRYADRPGPIEAEAGRYVERLMAEADAD